MAEHPILYREKLVEPPGAFVDLLDEGPSFRLGEGV
jgi:hypothetical protein